MLAWAEVNGAIAIVDERAGWNYGRERGVEVHGTLATVTWFAQRSVWFCPLNSDQDAPRRSQSPAGSASFTNAVLE